MKEYSYQAHHMGTTVTLSFVCNNRAAANTMAHDAFTTIKDYEKRFSRFLTESELSGINQNGSGSVSSEFITIFQRSLELAKLTDNNFNPLVQAKALGYTHTYTQLGNTISPNQNTPYSSNLTLCHINTETGHITLGKNQQIDFGGMLKGYVSTKLADTLMATHHDSIGCIINIGGDLTTRGVDAFHTPFIFYLYNPITEDEIPVSIQNASLATSGTYTRQWKTDTGVKNHIVDSKTHKNPTTDIVAVSIIANDGSFAEALTKLFFTRGVDEATAMVPPHEYQYQYFTVFKTGNILTTII